MGDAAGGWSRVINFSTIAPDAGSAARPLRAIQVGDMAYDQASDNTVARMIHEVESGNVDVVLHVGDIGCAHARWPLAPTRAPLAAVRSLTAYACYCCCCCCCVWRAAGQLR